MLDLLKAIIAVIIACGVMNCAQKKVATKSTTSVFTRYAAVAIDSEIYKKTNFIDNSKSATPYLSMNIAFDPVAAIRAEIEKKENVKLRHRGEAHITVISPPEYEQLKSVLTMELLNEVALLNRIQEAPFEILCIGRGQVVQDKKILSTYFIVVTAPELISLRHNIAKLYHTRGGLVSGFVPEDYYPHITIGYTDRDLHASDGVIKSKASCLIDAQLKAQ